MPIGATTPRYTGGIHHPDTTTPATAATRNPQPEISSKAKKSWGDKIRRFSPDRLSRLFTSRHSDGTGPSPKAKATVGVAVASVKAGLAKLNAQLKAACQCVRPETRESGTEGSNASRQSRNTQPKEPLEHCFTDPHTGHVIAEKSWTDEQGHKWKISHNRTTNITTTQEKTKWKQDPNDKNKVVRTVTSEADGKKTRWKEIRDVLTQRTERITKTEWKQDPNDENKVVRTVTSEADGKKTRWKEILDVFTQRTERITKTEWKQAPNDENKVVRTVTSEADGKKTRWKEIRDVFTGEIKREPFSTTPSANTTGASTSASHRSGQSGTPPRSSARPQRQDPAGTGNSQRTRFNNSDSDSTGSRDTPWRTVDEKTGRKERTFHRSPGTRPVKTEAKWTDQDGDWTETYNHETGVREAHTEWKANGKHGDMSRKVWRIENGIREEWTEIYVRSDGQVRMKDGRRFRVDDSGTGDTRGRRNATGAGAANARGWTGARGPAGTQEPGERPRERRNATGAGAANAHERTGARGPKRAQNPEERLRKIREKRIAMLAVLGLPPTAMQEEVNKAYKKLALQVHPDKNGNTKESEEEFKAVGNAKDFLMKDENWI